MTKNEYLAKLAGELKKSGVSDADDIVSEYEQHFAFKLADGFTEEEIAAKLGAPEAIAAQFESLGSRGSSGGGKAGLKILMGFCAVFEAMFYLLCLAWSLVVAASAVAFAALGVCLVGRLNIAGLIPSMPYASALILGAASLALSVFFAAGTYYFFAYTRQFVKVSVHWHRHVLSGGRYPSIPWNPQFSPRARRTLRAAVHWSVTVFGALFVLGMALSMILAGNLQFWHVWGWFVR